MVELFPHHLITSTNLLSRYIFVSIIFFIIGTFKVIYAKQSVVALSWLVGFCVFNYARAVLIDGSHFNFALQVFNPLIMLFTFHMITDPATGPRTTRYKIGFGFLIAALDCIMRIQRKPNSNYYALVLCCCLLPFIWNLEGSS